MARQKFPFETDSILNRNCRQPQNIHNFSLIKTVNVKILSKQKSHLIFSNKTILV